MLNKRVIRVNRICRLNRVSGGGGAAAWTPDAIADLTYFTFGPATCFSDAGGTTPCAVGDGCYTLVSAYGPACTLQQATGANQLILRQDGAGNYYLEGAVGRYMSGSFAGGTGNVALTLASSHWLTTVADSALPVAYGGVSSASILGGIAGLRDTAKWSMEYSGNKPYATDATADADAGQSIITTKAVGPIDTTSALYRNGAAAAGTGTPSADTPNLNPATLWLGTWGNFGAYHTRGRIYGVGIATRVLTAEEIALLDTYQQSLYA